MIEIREEHPADVAAIRDVNASAFSVLLSLVAIRQGRVVGHIMYSPASVGSTMGAALGPMAVLLAYQRQGIGSRLIEAGNRKLEMEGCPFIVVVGHANYYPRFGFRPASTCGIACEWDVPDDVFMVLVMDPEKMRGVTGLARYRSEFSNVS